MSKKTAPDFSGEPGPALHEGCWRFADFELDEVKRELKRAGQVVAIEAKPLNLLMLMLRHPHELLTRNELIDVLWTGRIVTESALARSVNKLRQALGDDAQTLIRTVHGYGYRFDGEAELITRTPLSSPPEVTVVGLELQAGTPLPERPHWRLQQQLGEHQCWLVAHEGSGERRVFKFASDGNRLAALKREVAIQQVLRQALPRHESYQRILDWNFDSPPWFIETAYSEGGNLAEWLQTQGGVQSVALDVRLGLMADIAEALATVHGLGILHKDLKPANVLIEPIAGASRPRIRLSDFGCGHLATAEQLRALAETRHPGAADALRTHSSDGLPASGTPLYLAPEVLGGEAPSVKADLYALGVMLYQLVAGNLQLPLAPGWERDVHDPLLREDIALAADAHPALRLAHAGELARRLRNLADRRATRDAQRATELAMQRTREAMISVQGARRSQSVLVLLLLVMLLGLGALYERAVHEHRSEQGAATLAPSGAATP